MEMMKSLVKRSASALGLEISRVPPADGLTSLADRFGSDKGRRYPAHMYCRIYERLFARLRYAAPCIVEIGLLITFGKQDASRVGVSAPSLAMWSTYFPNASIFGFDIGDFSTVSLPRCKTIQGDSSSRDDLARLVREINRPIDILIDDASHASQHQQTALGFLFPYIAPGGMFIIEDMCWQPPTLELRDCPKTRDVLRRAQVGLPIESPFMLDSEMKYFDSNIKQVLLYDSLTDSVADPTDSLAILIKREAG